MIMGGVLELCARSVPIRIIQWKVGKTQEEFEILFHRGWIYLECDGVVMHPAISDAIHSKSSKRSTIYQNMYVAMSNELELYDKFPCHFLPYPGLSKEE